MSVETTETRIKCAICGALTHSIQLHIEREGAHLAEGVKTVDDYQRLHPTAPLLSPLALARLEEIKRSKAEKAAKEKVTADEPGAGEVKVGLFHEVFGLAKAPATLSGSGRPIPITVLPREGANTELVPDLDPNYVFNIDVLKSVMMGLEMKIPVYVWGHAGTGKTTLLEQIAARTNRAILRVQHTANMEEEHVVGGWRLRDGKTVFELGPLPTAMINGWVYLADEYDFGRPEVLSVYQPVLEGKPLVIKEADPEHRVIRPHPNFRIVGTGNTNGQGDETGLYGGTMMQNAANYERFGIVEKMPYMDKELEARLVSQQAGIPVDDAKKLVDYANRIRQEFESSKLSNPISPRSLIYAAKVGLARMNYRIGLEKAYINRLTSADRESASQLAQRVFS